MHWNCPLTMLEKVLLARSGQPVYTTEFVEEYLKTLFFLSGDAVHYAHLAMTIWLIAANTVVYIWFVRRRLLPRT